MFAWLVSSLSNHQQDSQLKVLKSECTLLSKEENIIANDIIHHCPVRQTLKKKYSHKFFSCDVCFENLLPSRSLRRRKRIQDLPEPMQRLQREAWREATRRHRARKSAQATVSATDVTPTLDP